jgi:hypothetical protein
MRAFFAWVRQWFRDASTAAIRPSSLRVFGGRGVGAALGHLAMLTLVFWVLPFSVTFFDGARHGITALDDGLRTRVPPGAVFELKDGKLSTNLQEPLVVRNGDFALIVNTASSTMDLSATETGIVVMPDGVYQQDGVRRESISFSGAPPFRMSREDIRENIARWAPLVLFLGSLMVLLVVFTILLLGFIGSAVGHAFALWLALKIWKRSWHWKRAFVTTAYAATGPIVLASLLTLGDTDFSLVPTLLYWGLLAWILYDAVRSAPAPKEGGHDERKGKAVDRSHPESAS